MEKQAADIMTGNVIIVKEDQPLSEVVELFDKNRITAAPVVNEAGELTGIVTKSDVLGYYMDLNIKVSVQRNLSELIELESDQDALDSIPNPDIPVREVMTPDPVTAQADTTAKQLAETIITRRIHKVIIMEGASIKGIVSPIDFLYYIAGIEKE